ncbi:hypothetical protein C8R42DRAFT_728192 [Lentinula raphanica]|nr:hypothetical protein C8R42DRAFT_728192 [Lentinula raphanica]
MRSLPLRLHLYSRFLSLLPLSSFACLICITTAASIPPTYAHYRFACQSTTDHTCKYGLPFIEITFQDPTTVALLDPVESEMALLFFYGKPEEILKRVVAKSNHRGKQDEIEFLKEFKPLDLEEESDVKLDGVLLQNLGLAIDN